MKGKGIATEKATGDLIVTVEVAVPAELSDEQRAAIEQLAAGDREPLRLVHDGARST